jgi:rfaE bifunctional protein kinase chain/domain
MRKVVVYGNFKIIHPGHIRLLKFAKSLADLLIVGVVGAKTNQPEAESKIHERIEHLQSLKFVDEVFQIHGSIDDFIYEIKPDYLVKGQEFTNVYNSESLILDSYGGKLIFSSGSMQFDDEDLYHYSDNFENSLNRSAISDYMSRNKITKEHLLNHIESFKKVKVLVIGETIIDEYIDCIPIGMSSEEPLIVSKPSRSVKFLGGAAIVAGHANALGAHSTLLTLTGNDSESQWVMSEAKNINLKVKLICDETRSTILKQRFRIDGRGVFRLNKLNEHEIGLELQKKALDYVRQNVSNYDCLVFSDFNYGFITQTMVDSIVKLCKKNSVLVFADSQSSSQYGDVTKYNSTTLITPTEKEARISLRDPLSGLVVLAEKLRHATNAKNVVLKLGNEGALIHTKSLLNEENLDDIVPAINLAPVDVTGAGDSFLIGTSLGYVTTENIFLSSLLGSFVAAVQISRLGNQPVSSKEITSLIQRCIP